MTASKQGSELEKYRAKRALEKTPEPFGGTPISGVRRFVVQHHAATRLHYDFRLEWDGVLKSWAVPKGPSPNPADKRLAVRTEDHPLDYADFEGNIPESNYGAGSVIVWDRGLWTPLEDFDAGFVKGKLLFELKGHKLRGRWTLVKTKRAEKDWLLIKERDVYVDEGGTDACPADSVLSGLQVTELKDPGHKQETMKTELLDAGAVENPLRAKSQKPMLAQPGTPFSAPDWLFEIKFDGYRLIIDKQDNEVTLYSRNGHNLSASFPEIAQNVRKLPFDSLVMDGEAVVHDAQGLPSFSLLQKRGRLTRPRDIKRATLNLPATLYAFDLMAFCGLDLRAMPLLRRKAVLRQMLPTIGLIRFSDHVEEQGELMFAQAREMGLEGVVAKHGESRYTPGRSSDWRKISVEHDDDFVIVGFTDAKGGQTGFGALLLAQYIDDALTYTGRVGSGFSNDTLRGIGDALGELAEQDAPVNAPAGKDLHWVSPMLVASVKYKEITPDGLLRAPVFLGLRDDKEPRECRREYLEHKLPVVTAAAADTEEKNVPFTNLDKVFWEDEGYTKGALLDYYRAIAPWMLPYLKGRPVVLTRYPDGINGKSFYQKDAPNFVPDWIRTVKIWSEQSQRDIAYFVIEDVESLLYVINLGTIPVHIWSSRADSLEQPDWCILDLDPKKATFADVVKIAKSIHVLCDDVGLKHYVKTSGSTGLHVLIPLGGRYTYEQCRSLGEVLARIVVQELPDIATVTRAPANREDKVYVDFLQNRHGQTIAAPFSVRPLPGAPVSMPLTWRQVSVRNSNPTFTIANALKKIKAHKKDPMLPVLTGSTDMVEILGRLQTRF